MLSCCLHHDMLALNLAVVMRLLVHATSLAGFDAPPIAEWGRPKAPSADAVSSPAAGNDTTSSTKSPSPASAEPASSSPSTQKQQTAGGSKPAAAAEATGAGGVDKGSQKVAGAASGTGRSNSFLSEDELGAEIAALTQSIVQRTLSPPAQQAQQAGASQAAGTRAAGKGQGQSQAGGVASSGASSSSRSSAPTRLWMAASGYAIPHVNKVGNLLHMLVLGLAGGKGGKQRYTHPGFCFCACVLRPVDPLACGGSMAFTLRIPLCVCARPTAARKTPTS